MAALLAVSGPDSRIRTTSFVLIAVIVVFIVNSWVDVKFITVGARTAHSRRLKFAPVILAAAYLIRRYAVHLVRCRRALSTCVV